MATSTSSTAAEARWSIEPIIEGRCLLPPPSGGRRYHSEVKKRAEPLPRSP